MFWPFQFHQNCCVRDSKIKCTEHEYKNNVLKFHALHKSRTVVQLSATAYLNSPNLRDQHQGVAQRDDSYIRLYYMAHVTIKIVRNLPKTSLLLWAFLLRPQTPSTSPAHPSSDLHPSYNRLCRKSPITFFVGAQRQRVCNGQLRLVFLL